MEKIIRTRINKTRIKIIIKNKKTWSDKKKILVILAHPDDPEFFCGATLAKWVQEGHQITYYLLTRGEKGTNENFTDTIHIKEIREKEQKSAAEVIGVKKVVFSDHPDGFLETSLELRKELVRVMRKEKPDIVVSCDPSNYYIHNESINHPDHRAAGQAVIDAVFPAVQNKDFFPELAEEGLESHHVQELWLSLPGEENFIIDVTSTWDTKIKALLEHKSQIGDAAVFQERMRMRGKRAFGKTRHFEEFHRLIIRK